MFPRWEIGVYDVEVLMAVTLNLDGGGAENGMLLRPQSSYDTPRAEAGPLQIEVFAVVRATRDPRGEDMKNSLGEPGGCPQGLQCGQPR